MDIHTLFPRFKELPREEISKLLPLCEALTRVFEIDPTNILYPNKYESQQIINELIEKMIRSKSHECL